jgi:hypothetical protein
LLDVASLSLFEERPSVSLLVRTEVLLTGAEVAVAAAEQVI